MPEDDKVEIQFTDRNFVAKYGIKPVTVTPSVAKSYESKGWAKILSSLPVANPPSPPPEEDISELDFPIPERNLISRIGWIIGSGYIDHALRKVGEKLGFNVVLYYPDSFSPARIMASDLIILEYSFSGFSPHQIQQIKAIIFQKKIPFVVRVATELNDLPWLRQCSTYAESVIFSNEELFNISLDYLGEIIEDRWFIEEKGTFYNFWSTINKVLLDIQ